MNAARSLRAPRLLRPTRAAAAAPAPHAEQSEANGNRIVYAVSEALEHDWPAHVENASRVTAVLEGLRAGGLDEGPSVTRLEYETASPDVAKILHTDSYVDRVHLVAAKHAPTVLEMAGPTYVTQASIPLALRSLGAATALVDRVVHDSHAASGAGSTVGFGLVRPPGHHATPARPLGFCIFSTVAVAARHAQAAHGLQRVAIFDFDVHHGNGSDAAFERDPSVLFLSIHQDGSFPQTGSTAHAGVDDGEGFSINVNLPGDAGDSAYRDAWETVVAPALERFGPDIILVSAGYDAHHRDPVGGLQLRTSTFHWLCARLADVAAQHCGGRIVFLLEGGYDLKGLADGVRDSFRGVLGLPSSDRYSPELLRDEPLDKVAAALAEARAVHGL